MTNYKDKFKLLIEYNIKNGVKLEKINNEITEQEGDVETTETDVAVVEPKKPIEFEDTEEVRKLPEFEDLVKKDDIERVKEIQDLQTQEIEKLATYLESLSSDYSNLNNTLSKISETQLQGFLELFSKIKALTPPTPQESLDKMVKISGGVSVQDYFSQFDKEMENQDQLTNQIDQDKYVLNLKDLYNSVNSNDVSIKYSLTKF
jgi:hypothetical protein